MFCPSVAGVERTHDPFSAAKNGTDIAPGQATRHFFSPVAVFVGVLAWGWLWGVWGLLLGTPVLLIVKAVCDRVYDFRLLAAMLEH